MLLWTLLIVALCLPTGHAYPMYAEEIPNGDHVPHPCKPNFLWHGVGHENAQGGGVRNPFGKDFAANGHVWNTTLCRKDSDGDGRTNGEELGDPNCIWTKGHTPPTTSGITHPGVCEPMDAAICVGKDDWVDCSDKDEFNCDAINDAEVRNITIRFPRTKVPAKETTYICFNFALPDDQEYHMIANTPVIDNKNVMHHLVLYGCDSSAKLLSEPKECGMGGPADCEQTIALWSLGGSGQCVTPEAGFLIGKNHTRIVSMQIHWTNPTEVETWYDASGLTLFYTPKLRPHNAGVLIVGQQSLTIPPGKSSWVQEGKCTSNCTRHIFKGDIQVFDAQSHMHYLGIRQNLTLTRSGGQFEVLADDNPYNYDSPKSHRHEPPIAMSSGDELQTYCTFQSRSRNKTTVFGEGSFDEMCYAFISYYPMENLGDTRTCIQFNDVDLCNIQEKCDFSFLRMPKTSAKIQKVLEYCDPTGMTCRSECPAVIDEVVQSDPGCLRYAWDLMVDIIYRYYKSIPLLKFVSAMQSCPGRGENKPTMAPTHQPQPSPRPQTSPSIPTTPAQASGPGNWFLNLVKHLDARPLVQNIIMNVNYNHEDGTTNHAHDDSWN